MHDHDHERAITGDRLPDAWMPEDVPEEAVSVALEAEEEDATQVLEVGKRYPLVGALPREGVEFNYTAAGLLLRVFIPGATGPEVRAIRKGEARFALAVEGPAIFLLARFGDELAWGDAPFNVHLVNPAWRRTTLTLPETGGLRNMLQVHLVDSRSGILRALRVVGLPTPFTEAFEEALQDQVAAGWCGDAEYNAALAETYRRYSSDALALRAVAQASFPEKAMRR